MGHIFRKKSISDLSDSKLQFRANSFVHTGRFYESYLIEVVDIDRKELYSYKGSTLEAIKFEIYHDLIEFMNKREQDLDPLLYVTLESPDFWPILFGPREDYLPFG